MGIRAPRRKKDAFGKAMGIANIGMGVARLSGGDPTGALQVAGGLQGAGQQRQPVQQLQQQAAPVAPEPQQVQPAIDRRQMANEIPIEERIATLQAAEQALPLLPTEVQADVAPSLFQGIAMTVKEARAKGLA